MKILSLFDGISCARVALERAGIPVEKYYASEIDKYATQIAQKNYPDTIQVGSVVGLDTSQFKDIDILIGGSPCQDLSIAKKDRKGLDGERSGLFWEYVRILKEVKPKYFILENVASMSKEAKQIITETLGVESVMINAALVSAQNRKRLFWIGKWNGEKYNKVDIPQPEDRGILLRDILEPTALGGGRRAKTGLYAVDNVPYVQDKSYCIPSTYYKENVKSLLQRKKKGLYVLQDDGTLKVREATKKGYAIATEGQSVDLSFPTSNMQIRKLTPIECERLQSLPDNYTDGVSNSQRYKALGNAFNVEVVAHILKNAI